ncbi:MAG: LamG-like jellyroll fold domain-containing protein, partial [Verrucomicrobiota bacterium]|nr:LamG-like jellyroll fold domain-containing protein [Verrucomicrobiota bacterium]
DLSGRMRHGTYVGFDATDLSTGIVSQSGQVGAHAGTRAFDNLTTANNSHCWRAPAGDLPAAWVSYEFPSPVEIIDYSILPVPINNNLDNRSPGNWRFQAEDDNGTWIDLHVVTGETGWVRAQAKRFTTTISGMYSKYRLLIEERANPSGTGYLGLAELELFSAPKSFKGMFGKAIDLNGEYFDLPFRADQDPSSSGLTFSAWVYPRQVQNGSDNERMLFSTDDGGWDWSSSMRLGSLTAWTGSERVQSPLNVFPDQWYHVASVFDPSQNRTVLFLNGKSTTLNSLGYDGSNNLLRVGRDFGDRTFDGLLDDVRIWGRPLSILEVSELWGNGMGDLGPKARIEIDSPTWGTEVSGLIRFNQPILDFNASEDLEMSGLSLSSVSEVADGNQTFYQFTATPNSLSEGILSIKLKGNAVTGAYGLKNEEDLRAIDFRPHRIKESELSLWWELNEGTGDKAYDSSIDFDPNWTPSSLSGGTLLWLDASDSSTISETAGTVSEWRDKGANGNDLTPHDFSDPTTNAETQNDLNVIVFDGDDILTRNSTSGIGDVDQTWMIVFKVSPGGVSNAGDGIISYDQWVGNWLQDGHWQLQASNGSQFRARLRKKMNVASSWIPTSNFSNSDLSGSYHLFCFEFDRTNLHHTNWMDGNLNDYQVSDPTPLRDNRRFSIMGNRGRNQPTAGSVAEVVGMPSILESDRMKVQNYLSRKWGLPIGQNRGVVEATWESPAQLGNSMVSFSADSNEAVVLSSGLYTDLTTATLSLWVYTETETYHWFSLDGSAQFSLSLQKQRPLLVMSGLNQQSLPGTNVNEFWGRGTLPLNEWSHLAFSYDLNAKRARFFLNGKFDSETSFAGNLALPLSQAFRLGPQDGSEATATRGKADDFRIYNTALSQTDIEGIYGSGGGDFHNRSIEFAYSSELQLPKFITIRFLEDGLPTELNASSFDLSDLSVSNGSATNLSKIENGIWTFALSPDNNATSTNIEIEIAQGSITTAIFGEIFPETNATVSYNPQTPAITSSSTSHWEVGLPGSFAIQASDATALSVAGLPGGFEYNATTRMIHGTPLDGNRTNLTITASNPVQGSVQQIHLLKIFDSSDFAASLHLAVDAKSLGGLPSDYPGLVAQFDASRLTEANGSVLHHWQDASGAGRDLDQSRGAPQVLISDLSDNKKIVRFDGRSQLYSSFDFGSLLGDYSIFAIARHAGGENESVISSVGSDWVFGLGNGKSAYWRLGSDKVFEGSSADTSWGLYAGTLSPNGVAKLYRNGYEALDGNVSLNADSKPRLLALGGSQANSNFSNSEVAELLVYDRFMSPVELNGVSEYLRLKWLGGSLKDFPILVRLSSAEHPSFDLSTFSDPATGGDLRFQDERNRELAYEIDEWNASGESLIWVHTLEFSTQSVLRAYWGNDGNSTSPNYTLWNDYQGVWHLSDAIDSSSNGYDLSEFGSPGILSGSSLGSGAQLDGSSYYYTSGYQGIDGNNSRSVSLWIKTSESDSYHLGWGDAGNLWNLGWNAQGPFAETENASGRRQGQGSLSDGQWHHLLISYPGEANLSATRVFLDGERIDLASSIDGVVNTTTSIIPLKVGASSSGGSKMTGWLDEVRVSTVDRDHAWAKYSYQN